MHFSKQTQISNRNTPNYMPARDSLGDGLCCEDVHHIHTHISKHKHTHTHIYTHSKSSSLIFSVKPLGALGWALRWFWYRLENNLFRHSGSHPLKHRTIFTHTVCKTQVDKHFSNVDLLCMRNTCDVNISEWVWQLCCCCLRQAGGDFDCIVKHKIYPSTTQNVRLTKLQMTWYNCRIRS